MLIYIKIDFAWDVLESQMNFIHNGTVMFIVTNKMIRNHWL